MLKKLAAITLIVLAVTGSVFARGAGADAANSASTVKVLAAISGGKDDAENLLFQQALEKGTGLKISWEMPPSYDQVLMQKLGAGDAYDLIYVGQAQMYSFAEQGIIMDLTDRLKKSAVIQANYPAGELDKIAYNGKYYAGFNKLEVYSLPNVNKVITDKAGVDISKLSTLDDYYNMLKTVKNYKETVEGKKPYYPFYIYMPDVWDVQAWFSSQGLRRGVYIDAGGKKSAPYVSDAALPVWEWFAKLYREELIDPVSFTGKTSDMRSRLWQSQEIVLDSDWVAWTGLYNSNAMTAGTYPNEVNVVGLPGVLGPSGKYFLEQGGASLWAIPVNAKNPDGAFKIIEYFASKEGALLLSAGIEGHDYTISNGKITFTEIGAAHSKDHGAPFPISTQFNVGSQWNLNPGVADAYALRLRSDIAIEPMGYANGQLDTRQFYDTVARWLTDCMMGRVDAASAIKNAEAELRNKKIID
jgi:putative aldouronate transport system substrate-binding protein